MKQLKSLMVMNIGGVNRVTATYDEIDDQGMPVSKNNKFPFYAVEPELIGHIEALQSIVQNKLGDNLWQ